MAQEDKKIVEVFTTQGAQFKILTRMPTKEIHVEMAGGNDNNSQFIELIGLNELEEHVDVRVVRDYLAAYFLHPFRVSQIARVQPVIQQ